MVYFSAPVEVPLVGDKVRVGDALDATRSLDCTTVEPDGTIKPLVRPFTDILSEWSRQGAMTPLVICVCAGLAWVIDSFPQGSVCSAFFVGALSERAGNFLKPGPISTMERLYWYSMSNNSSFTARPA